MKKFERLSLIATAGALLMGVAKMAAFGTSWILFNEVEPPKSLQK